MGCGLRCILVAAMRMLLAGLAAAAHPHVWIEMSSDVVFDDKGQVDRRHYRMDLR